MSIPEKKKGAIGVRGIKLAKGDELVKVHFITEGKKIGELLKELQKRKLRSPRDVYLLTVVPRFIPVILELYAVTAADVSEEA